MLTWHVRSQAVAPPQGERAGWRRCNTNLKPKRRVDHKVKSPEVTRWGWALCVKSRLFVTFFRDSHGFCYFLWEHWLTLYNTYEVILRSSYSKVSSTCSWQSVPCGDFLGHSLKPQGFSRYSGFWDEFCPLLVFLVLSFCLCAQDVKTLLELRTKQTFFYLFFFQNDLKHFELTHKTLEAIKLHFPLKNPRHTRLLSAGGPTGWPSSLWEFPRC